MKKTIAIILAGGVGKRFGKKLPKQFHPINNIPLFIYALKTFEKYQTILTMPKKYKDLAIVYIKKYNLDNVYVIKGGETRQESVFNGLQYIEKFFSCDNVIITDANRPCIKKETINTCLKSLNRYKGVVTVVKNINTNCISKDNKTIDNILDRKNMYELLMPQCFNFKTILIVHKLLKNKIKNATDDAQLLLNFSPHIKIKLVKISLWEGIKITYPEDIKIFETLLKEE